MTPVTVLSSKAIEASGELNVSDFLRDLPALIAMPLTNAYLQTLPALAPVVQAINQFNATGNHCMGTAATNTDYD
jgi:hypothetical protein